ncbi:TIGR03086 family metal-binding protein [Mycolicibacterium sp. 141076]|uniref:TIGR03086 family metal-binding protein n=1 Tax=Mycobacteriaceae TaxID=1762 RepID=UPI00299EF803|nr:TIGR03086 family metal-binding protein [Mycolicibacterium sp. 141076]MDX1881607.1 TIGR03086 family metal-binding protein [Mycolicibacterium sp. 141076]
MPTLSTDLLSAHRRAILASVDVVNTVGLADLRRPTPCAAWDLADLLAHMTVQHRGFAAAAHGGGQDLALWNPASCRDTHDPVGDYAAAAHDVVDAFGAADPDSQFALPELGTSVPAEMGIGFHLIDYVVHGWDVAASLGVPFALPDDVVATALPLALAVPDGDFRSMPDAPFGPAQAGDSATDFDGLLRHLGRDPQWGDAVGHGPLRPIQ